MYNLVTQLLGSVANRRQLYVAFVALAALVVFAAFVGADQTDW